LTASVRAPHRAFEAILVIVTWRLATVNAVNFKLFDQIFVYMECVTKSFYFIISWKWTKELCGPQSVKMHTIK
jgi:hypothetical protein